MPLLERDAELGALDGALTDAEAGTGSLLVVEGPAGTGKSAIVAWAVARATARGLRVVGARGGELEQNDRFGIVRQLGGSEDDDVRALHELATATASSGPLLVAVDDAHWSDIPSLEAVDYLARRLADLPVLLALAHCADEPGADDPLLDGLGLNPHATRFWLRPLTVAAATSFIRFRRPGATEGACEAAFEATGGNPAQLEELLSAHPRLLEQVGPDPLRAACVVGLGDRVVRRAARVAPQAAALLKCIAVVGDGERLELSADITGIAPEAAAEIAHRLRRMGILDSEDPATFAQPLVRRSIYRGMPDAERYELHADAAAAHRTAGAPPEIVAPHLTALPANGNAGIAAALVAAADAAPESRQAATWLRRALEEGADDPPRAELLQKLGMAELLARDSAAIDHLQEALDLAREPSERLRMGLGLAEIMLHAGQWEEGMAVMRYVEPDVGDDDELGALFAATLAVASAHDSARVHIFDSERARFEELSQGRSWEAKALSALLASVSAQRGAPPHEVRELVERALADGTLLRERGGGWAAPQVAMALVTTDSIERALVFCDEMEAASRRNDSVTELMVATMGRGWIHSRLGDLVAAEAEIEGALEQLVDQKIQMIHANAYFMLGDALTERPGLEGVAHAVETARLDPAFLGTLGGVMLPYSRARLRLARGDRARAVEDLRAAGRIASKLRIAPSLMPWRSTLALALPRQEHAEAIALAHEELLLARATGLARPEGVALRAVGLLTPREPGLATLRAAVAVLEHSPARLEHARALVELGAALRRAQRRATAREPLQDGLDLALECGAAQLAARARDELSATTGRSARRSPASGRLTPSELRVARLAAAGTSTADIAEDLFVSVKTVETHLSHVYAKLGLGGRGARRQLTEVLAPYEPALRGK